MPTYDTMAKELGVTKQTVRNWSLRLDPDGDHVDKTGETHVIDAELASMIAHEITRKKGVRGPAASDASGQGEATIATVVNVADSKVEALRSHYEEVIRLKDDGYGALLEEKDDRIRELKERLEETIRQLDQERSSHDRTRAELALSRALEGFKWPWQRREIMTRYALPEPRND